MKEKFNLIVTHEGKKIVVNVVVAPKVCTPLVTISISINGDDHKKQKDGNMLHKNDIKKIVLENVFLRLFFPLSGEFLMKIKDKNYQEALEIAHNDFDILIHDEVKEVAYA